MGHLRTVHAPLVVASLRGATSSLFSALGRHVSSNLSAGDQYVADSELGLSSQIVSNICNPIMRALFDTILSYICLGLYMLLLAIRLKFPTSYCFRESANLKHSGLLPIILTSP